MLTANLIKHDNNNNNILFKYVFDQCVIEFVINFEQVQRFQKFVESIESYQPLTLEQVKTRRANSINCVHERGRCSMCKHCFIPLTPLSTVCTEKHIQDTFCQNCSRCSFVIETDETILKLFLNAHAPIYEYDNLFILFLPQTSMIRCLSTGELAIEIPYHECKDAFFKSIHFYHECKDAFFKSFIANKVYRVWTNETTSMD